MKITFRIFEVSEDWLNTPTGEPNKLVTMFEDWGKEFESEEAALLHLDMTHKDRVKAKAVNGHKPEEIIIQRIITI